MKVAFHTLGCKNNQLETSAIADEFRLNNWDIVDFNSKADVYIINTCTVTAKTDSNSRNSIRKAVNHNPGAKVVVTGCYAQVSYDEIAKISGVNLIVGHSKKNDIYKLVDNLFKGNLSSKIIVEDVFKQNSFNEKQVYSASGRTRINVKVQDGCNYRCSYCIVPFARGPSRSNNLDNVIKQVSIVAEDYPEVVLTSTHLGQYGLDLTPKSSLVELLKNLESIDSLQRLRLSSIDPLELTDELIQVIIDSKKICRHLHISIQSGNDEILKAMNRRYKVDTYKKIINRLNDSIDGLAIGSDIIVGFPGETDKHFQITYNNLNDLPLSYLHIFTYSKRKGTIASKMPDHVDPKVQKLRSKALKELSDNKNYYFKKTFMNKTLSIIPENESDKESGWLKGLSDNYISVLIDLDDSYKGKIIPVNIINVTPNKVIGKLVC